MIELHLREGRPDLPSRCKTLPKPNSYPNDANAIQLFVELQGERIGCNGSAQLLISNDLI
jgi:hypothetical protein